MKYSASLQVHKMAKKLFIKKMAKINRNKINITVIAIQAIKDDCYLVAGAFYGEDAVVIE